MDTPHPHKVLLVEDEDSLRLSLEIKLNMTGQFLVTSCPSGEDALERLQSGPYDVVLLDYRLPGLSGLDVLRWMHEHKILTPVIILSGVDEESLPIEAMRLGAYDYLRKAHMDYEGLTLAIQSVYERYLYRMQLSDREKGELEQQQRQQELETLRTFQNSVTSIGQFAENGLSGLLQKIEGHRANIAKLVSAENTDRFNAIFKELRHDIELVSSGVKSMVDLSSLVSKKLSGIERPSEPEQ
jgi:DNA-binding NtrC family response regulator